MSFLRISVFLSCGLMPPNIAKCVCPGCGYSGAKAELPSVCRHVPYMSSSASLLPETLKWETKSLILPSEPRTLPRVEDGKHPTKIIMMCRFLPEVKLCRQLVVGRGKEWPRAGGSLGPRKNKRKSHWQRNLAGCCPWSCKSRTRLSDQTTIAAI